MPKHWIMRGWVVDADTGERIAESNVRSVPIPIGKKLLRRHPTEWEKVKEIDVPEDPRAYLIGEKQRPGTSADNAALAPADDSLSVRMGGSPVDGPRPSGVRRGQ